MIASKLGMSMLTVAMLTATALGYAQQAEAAPPPVTARTTATSATASAAAHTSSTDKSRAAGSPAKSSAGTQASDPGLSDAQLKEARDDGYKPVTRGSAKLYCKSEILVGSAFPMHICYNSDRLKIVMHQEEAERMQLQQMHGGGLQGH